MSGYWTGKKIPEETRIKISNTLKGRKLTKEHSMNISKSLKGKPCGVKQEKHPRWNKNRRSYFVLHDWVKERLGVPDTCENCGRRGLSGRFIQWANISGKYKRHISDWARLCTRCHHLIDNIKVKQWQTIKNSK